MSETNSYSWVRSIRRYWILPLELVPVAFLVFAAFAGVVRVFAPESLGVGASYAAGGALALGLVVAFAQHFLFYSAIRCPKCGHNPTKYQNGKNLPTKTAWKKLSGMTACTACGGL